MSVDSPKPVPTKEKPAQPGEASRPGTGEGAQTALEAMIRKRKLAEKPEQTLPDRNPTPPAQP